MPDLPVFHFARFFLFLDKFQNKLIKATLVFLINERKESARPQCIKGNIFFLCKPAGYQECLKIW
jgi:hypothetical protein